jgi:hypothetical protein
MGLFYSIQRAENSNIVEQCFIANDDLAHQTTICDNDDLLPLIRIEINNLKKNTTNIIPFPIEPQLSHIQSDESSHRIQLFLDNNYMILKWIGETGWGVPTHKYIYRHYDNDIYTFWLKHDTIYSIKPFIPFHDDPIAPISINLLPHGPGIPP